MDQPDAMPDAAFTLADVPTRAKLAGRYRDGLVALQAALRTLQLAYMRQGLRGIVVFEGWDASGKGGVIRRMASVLEPRALNYWSIGPPPARWQGRHHLERFWQLLPEAGRLAVFDRSWYGRVLVERVDALTERAAWQRAYREITDFERMLLDDGVHIVKLFMHISAEEQRRRFKKRLADPEKRWKLSVADIRNWEQRDAYARAIEDMIRLTSTERAPWHVIPADNKKAARVEALRVIHDTLAEGVDLRPPTIDAETATAARTRLGLDLPGDLQ
ncbi:Polyphosphate kinase 2, PPK2 family [Limimonas halophila]|uniref:Polyphosphate kinase 2, PPK2 family n=1 Tax=Limimonas halophila TaxID=1082479 RepID=A0A1G7QKF0_9PROT|nr:polyphosphate kinase [Limimonas halophila]SDF98993.1 Polyphosphate kinase 2, PPK2 family [Limimonas halophila]